MDVEEDVKLNDCFFEKKDWRACKDEVRISFGSRRGIIPSRTETSKSSIESDIEK